MRQLRLVLPSTQDPLANLTALVAHMQQQFGAEVECYDIDLQGGVKVERDGDLGLSAHPRLHEFATFSPRAASASDFNCF